MKVITGGKIPVKIWCKKPEDSAVEQAMNLANHPATFHHVALMPDTHFGFGMPIGGVVAMENCISPYCVGSDQSCGMMACKTNLKADKISKDVLTQIVHQIKRDVPMGKNRCSEGIKTEIFNRKFDDIWKIYNESGAQLKDILNLKFPDCVESVTKDWEKNTFKEVASQLGTLGGG